MRSADVGGFVVHEADLGRPETVNGAMNQVEHASGFLMMPSTAVALLALSPQAVDTVVSENPWQDRSLGSTVPCAVPLEWRIGEMDPRFEVDDSAARRAVEKAAALWERGVGRELFVHEPGSGFPVRFVFDDRQALLQVRRQLQRDLEDSERHLEARRGELAELRDAFREAQSTHEERLASYHRRIAAHDAEVRRWNARGGAPDSVRTDLQRTRAHLEMERRSLERQQQELRALQEWFRTQTQTLNERIRDQNRRGEGLQRETPVMATEAGRYAESVLRRNGKVVSVDREVVVFRFDGIDELVRLLAHELGHALGLGHSAVEGSGMHAVSGAWSQSADVTALPRSDIEMLLERCPALRE